MIVTELGEEILKVSKEHPEIPFNKIEEIAERFVNWQKEQMMNEAVEGTIVYNYEGGYTAIKPNWLIGNIGDRVHVLIINNN